MDPVPGQGPVGVSSPCPARLSAPLCLSHVHEGQAKVLDVQVIGFFKRSIKSNKNHGILSTSELLVIFVKPRSNGIFWMGTSQFLLGTCRKIIYFQKSFSIARYHWGHMGMGSYNLRLEGMNIQEPMGK